MGDRTDYPGQSGGSVGRKYVELKLQLNGASLPTVVDGKSYLDPAAPVSHTGGTNVVGVLMRDAWPEVVAHSVDIRDDAGNGAYATIGNFANEGSATRTPITFNIRTFNSGGSAMNNSTNVVVIQLAIRNSSVTYGNQ